MQMGIKIMSLLPEITVIAGPNGSGKSTITSLTKITGVYINADDIKKSTHCSDPEAAISATELREKCLRNKQDFTFETVLSTTRNLDLLKEAKRNGYFIRCIYILTADENINVSRVKTRKLAGGHDVPEDKIRKRFKKALEIIPELVEVCDIMHIYDNSENKPFRIFKKRKTKFFGESNCNWTLVDIKKLTGINELNSFSNKS